VRKEYRKNKPETKGICYLKEIGGSRGIWEYGSRNKKRATSL
jgi:hypothetical protein